MESLIWYLCERQRLNLATRALSNPKSTIVEAGSTIVQCGLVEAGVGQSITQIGNILDKMLRVTTRHDDESCCII